MENVFEYHIINVRTRPMPNSPRPAGRVLFRGPGIRITLRHCYVSQWTRDLANTRITTLYRGTERIPEDHITIGKSRINDTLEETYAIYDWGHRVEAPILLDNVVPYGTTVSFLEVCRRLRQRHTPAQPPQAPLQNHQPAQHVIRVHPQNQQPPIYAPQYLHFPSAQLNGFPFPWSLYTSPHGLPAPPLPPPPPVVAQPVHLPHIQHAHMHTATRRRCRPVPHSSRTVSTVLRFFGVPEDKQSPLMSVAVRNGSKRGRDDEDFEDCPIAKRKKIATTLVGLAGAIGMVAVHIALAG